MQESMDNSHSITVSPTTANALNLMTADELKSMKAEVGIAAHGDVWVTLILMIIGVPVVFLIY